MGRKGTGQPVDPQIVMDQGEAFERVRLLQQAQQKVDQLRERFTALTRERNSVKAQLQQATWDRDHWMRVGLTRYAETRPDANGKGGEG